MFVVMAAMLIAALAVPEASTSTGSSSASPTSSYGRCTSPSTPSRRGATTIWPARCCGSSFVDDQRRPDPHRGLHGRRRSDRAVGDRSRDRLPRRARRPWRRLAPLARPLRRAARPDHHHRDRRVDRRPRHRRGRDAAQRGSHHGGATRDHVAAALWWTYFDWVSIVTEQQLRQATGTQQTELARDAYSYLHFLMVTGIVLFAVALKKTLADFDAHLGRCPRRPSAAGWRSTCSRTSLLGSDHESRHQRGFFRRVGRGRPLAMSRCSCSGRSPATFPLSPRSHS